MALSSSFAHPPWPSSGRRPTFTRGRRRPERPAHAGCAHPPYVLIFHVDDPIDESDLADNLSGVLDLAALGGFDNHAKLAGGGDDVEHGEERSSSSSESMPMQLPPP